MERTKERNVGRKGGSYAAWTLLNTRVPGMVVVLVVVVDGPTRVPECGRRAECS